MILVFRELGSLHICERRVGSGRGSQSTVGKRIWRMTSEVPCDSNCNEFTAQYPRKQTKREPGWLSSCDSGLAADCCASGSLQQVQTEVTDVRPIKKTKKKAVCNQHC